MTTRFGIVASLAAIVLTLASGRECHAALACHYLFEGSALDTAGSHDGTLVGDATFSPNVPTGIGSTQSLALDGALDKMIYDAVAADTISGSFTIAAWVNAAERRPVATLAFVGTRSPDTFGTDFKYIADGAIRMDIGNGSAFLTITDTPVTYGLNEWHHVAVVVQPGQYELYFDGASLGTTGIAAGTPLLLDADHDMAIGAVGAFLFSHGEDFHGLIDDVRIYNTALTGDEVRQAMRGVPEPSTGVIFASGILATLLVRRASRSTRRVAA